MINYSELTGIVDSAMSGKKPEEGKKFLRKRVKDSDEEADKRNVIGKSEDDEDGEPDDNGSQIKDSNIPVDGNDSKPAGADDKEDADAAEVKAADSCVKCAMSKDEDESEVENDKKSLGKKVEDSISDKVARIRAKAGNYRMQSKNKMSWDQAVARAKEDLSWTDKDNEDAKKAGLLTTTGKIANDAKPAKKQVEDATRFGMPYNVGNYRDSEPERSSFDITEEHAAAKRGAVSGALSSGNDDDFEAAFGSYLIDDSKISDAATEEHKLFAWQCIREWCDNYSVRHSYLEGYSDDQVERIGDKIYERLTRPRQDSAKNQKTGRVGLSPLDSFMDLIAENNTNEATSWQKKLRSYISYFCKDIVRSLYTQTDLRGAIGEDSYDAYNSSSEGDESIDVESSGLLRDPDNDWEHYGEGEEESKYDFTAQQLINEFKKLPRAQQEEAVKSLGLGKDIEDPEMKKAYAAMRQYIKKGTPLPDSRIKDSKIKDSKEDSKENMKEEKNMSMAEKAMKVLDGIGKPVPTRKPHITDGIGKAVPTRKPHITDGIGKSVPSRKPHLTKDQIVDALTRKPKVSKDQIADALAKRKAGRSYEAFKVTDSYINIKKKIQDALEETETTDDAINVALDALNEVPAEQAVAAVIEVLSEAIDILQANGCEDGTCDGVGNDEALEDVSADSSSDSVEGAEAAQMADVETAETGEDNQDAGKAEDDEKEEETEEVADSAPSDAEIDALVKALNADGANVSKAQLKKAYASFKKDAAIEDSVNVTVTNEAGETVTVDSEGGDSTVGADVPVEPAMPEPMGGIEGEEPMPSELPELGGEPEGEAPLGEPEEGTEEAPLGEPGEGGEEAPEEPAL